MPFSRRRGGSQMLMRGGRFAVYLMTFNQQFTERLINGDFSAWTGDNPDGWTIGSESGSDPAVSEVGSGQDHTGTGTGSANFYTSATNFQPIATQSTVFGQHNWFLVDIVPSFVTGTLRVQNPSGGTNFAFDLTSATRRKSLFRDTNSDLRFQILPLNVTPTDVTLDSVSAQIVTLNTQQTGLANGVSQFEFTLPVSPVRGDSAILLYRIQDNQNFWQVRVEWNGTQWTFQMGKVVSGAIATSAISTNLGATAPNAMRVTHNGNSHIAETRIGTTWTQQGSEQTDSHVASSTGVNVVYGDTVTPTLLQVSFL